MTEPQGPARTSTEVPQPHGLRRADAVSLDGGVVALDRVDVLRVVAARNPGDVGVQRRNGMAGVAFRARRSLSLMSGDSLPSSPAGRLSCAGFPVASAVPRRYAK
jgi:hypothetical protein